MLVACGSLVPTPSDPAVGGMGLPQQLDGEAYPGPMATMNGSVFVGEDGCVYLLADAPRLVIWPAGSELSSPVRLPDGTELRDGQEITVEARLVPADDLPGGPDGYWGHVTGFCQASGADVVVADRVSAGR
jgi:hypothetical protein